MGATTGPEKTASSVVTPRPAGKRGLIELPLKLVLSEKGSDFYIRNRATLARITLSDSAQDYGLAVRAFYPADLERLIAAEYVSRMELSRPELLSKRQEILALARLVVRSVICRRFEHALSRRAVAAPAIQRWNRAHPRTRIDERTDLAASAVDATLNERAAQYNGIVAQALDRMAELDLSEDGVSYEDARSRGSDAAYLLKGLSRKARALLLLAAEPSRDDLNETLADYVGKLRIADYFALMLMEVAAHAETNNLVSFARRAFPELDPERVLRDERVRRKVIEKMSAAGENLVLTWRIGGKSSRIGQRTRMQVLLINRERDYARIRREIDEKKRVSIRERSLVDFYKALPPGEADSGLGMYYLSYLKEQCERRDFRFDSTVGQAIQEDMTVITLSLYFP